ncbi:MAG: 30S ribosomal protein S4e [Candidatus Bathyarchaeota archaeon]|nr:30S ribosomal protein S4e [Candidatus Bathyarchaeota archaeon]
MGRKGERGHLKRKPAPKLWPIHRKEAIWTVKPKPGPHPIVRSLPLALIVRDILGYAKTAKEAKNIISKGLISVDGKVRRDERFLVGLMDVVSIDITKKAYRVLPSGKGLYLSPIDSADAFKLYRIENKTIVKGGGMQLDLHDGTSFLVDSSSTENPATAYATLDVLKLSVPEREILAHTKLRVGSPVVVIGGKNMGKSGKIDSIEKQADKKRRDLIVTLKDANGEKFQTILDFVFILGDAEPLITVPEAK